MNILTETFNELKAEIISANIGIKMIDLWNNQTANTETENIVTPALYVELTDLQFKPQKNALQADAIIRIHLLQQQFKNADQALSLIDNLLHALYNVVGNHFSALEPVTYSPDFDHDHIRHDVLEFSTSLWHELPTPSKTEVSPNIELTIIQ